MTRQNINIGTNANDGTGDTLRSAGTKINQNFQEIYTQLGGDSSTLSTRVTIIDSAVVFEGFSADVNETKLIAIDPTADRTVSLPNATGTIVLKDTTDTLTNKTLTAPVISTISNTGTITLPTSTDTLVGRATTDTLTNKTITTPTITRPIIQDTVKDSAGAVMIDFVSTASAVNHVKVTNNSTSNDPIVAASGDDANINLKLTSKGKGAVEVSKMAYTAATMTASGIVDSDATLIICNSGSTLALDLSNGTTVGEFKIFTNKNSGKAVVTPQNFTGSLSAFEVPQNRATQCVWDGTNWFMINGSDSTTNVKLI